MVLKQVEIGCDPFDDAISQARKSGVYGRIYALSAEHLAGIEPPVSTIISNSVVEHVSDLPTLLAAVSALLVPGGCFVFTSPSESFSRCLALPSATYQGWRNRRLNHVNLLSPAEWSERLAAVGLHVESVSSYLSRGLVIFWDAIDLAEQLWWRRTRVVGALWKRLPQTAIDRLAFVASSLDLSGDATGGGQMIVARKGKS